MYTRMGNCHKDFVFDLKTVEPVTWHLSTCFFSGLTTLMFKAPLSVSFSKSELGCSPKPEVEVQRFVRKVSLVFKTNLF